MTAVYNQHLQNAGYSACRALEFLESPRDQDDDVQQARHKYLFEMLADLTLAAKSNGIQILQVKAELAIVSYFSGNKTRAFELVQDILNHNLIKPHASLKD